MLKLIPQIFQVLLFFIGLWKERDQKKAAAKKEVADRITDAFSKTEKEHRASALNAAIGDINRMR
jgi:hypothetical protein